MHGRVEQCTPNTLTSLETLAVLSSLPLHEQKKIKTIKKKHSTEEAAAATNNIDTAQAASIAQSGKEAKTLKTLKIGTRPLFLFSTMAGPNLELFKVGATFSPFSVASPC